MNYTDHYVFYVNINIHTASLTVIAYTHFAEKTTFRSVESHLWPLCTCSPMTLRVLISKSTSTHDCTIVHLQDDDMNCFVWKNTLYRWHTVKHVRTCMYALSPNAASSYEIVEIDLQAVCVNALSRNSQLIEVTNWLRQIPKLSAVRLHWTPLQVV